MKEPAILWERLLIGNYHFADAFRPSSQQSRIFYRKEREGRKGLKMFVQEMNASQNEALSEMVCLKDSERQPETTTSRSFLICDQAPLKVRNQKTNERRALSVLCGEYSGCSMPDATLFGCEP